MSKFKGVEIKQQTTGGALYVRFRDPRTSPKRQVYRSTETTDMGVAERIAGEISGLIYGPKEHWYKLPSGLHPTTEHIWSPQEQQADDMTQDHMVTVFLQLESGHTQANHQEFQRAKKKLIEMINTIRDIPKIMQERDALRLENMMLKAQLKKMNVKAIKDGARKPISKAVDDFFDSGACGSLSGWRDALRGWFDRLSNELGPDTNVMDVTPEQVAAHINSLTKGKKKNKKPISADTKRRIRINISTFLRHATNDNFDARQLITLTKGLAAQARMETNTEWFWLTAEQAKAILTNITEQYWKDAALCQWQLGLRAEELPLLMSRNVDFTKNQIKIARIFDGKQLVRRLKTDNSEESVQLNKAVNDAITRRLAAKNFLLFPCYSLEALVAPRFRLGLTDFETKHQLWPVPAMTVDDDESEKGGDGYTFTSFYRRLLRKAAKGVLTETKKMDSRTFRRTCARELVLKYGCDRAASVLRDDVDTIKKHYGNLVPSDTSTER